MKYKFKLNLGRGLALAAVALSLASLNSLALTSATQTNLAASARSPLAPATKMTAMFETSVQGVVVQMIKYSFSASITGNFT